MSKEKKVLRYKVKYTSDAAKSHKYVSENDVKEHIFLNIKPNAAVGVWVSKDMKEMPDQIIIDLVHGVSNNKTSKLKKKDK